jgi:hypothetical protein
VSDTLARSGREILTPRSIARIDAQLDREDVFSKQFTRLVDGKVTTVGLRIGVKPGHVVALFGDTVIRAKDGSYSIRRGPGVTADQWNVLVPVGSRVVAYPGVRPEDPLAADVCVRLETVTRAPAWTLGRGEPVVSVEGYAGGISLAHVDVVGSAR